MMGEQNIIVVPLVVPPSANNLYANVGRRRVTTNEYRKWLHLSGLMLNRLRGADIGNPGYISVGIEANINRRRDIDNIIKPTVDLLTKCGVTKKDDRYLDFVSARRVQDDEDIEKDWMRVTITLQE